MTFSHVLSLYFFYFFIQGSQAALRNLSSKITKLDTDSLKQQEIIYNQVMLNSSASVYIQLEIVLPGVVLIPKVFGQRTEQTVYM